MSGPGADISPDSPPSQSAASWLDAVRREVRRGELLGAFDLAERGLAEHPDDLSLKHRAVLALARAGATAEAARRFEQYGLDGIADEDVAALRARIAKDVALAGAGPERRRGAARAAELYGAIFSDTGGYYPAVNAATLWLVAGEEVRSRELAGAVLDAPRRQPDRTPTTPWPRSERRTCCGARRTRRGAHCSRQRRSTAGTTEPWPQPAASCA